MKIGYLIAGVAVTGILGYVGYLYLWDPTTKTWKSKNPKTPETTPAPQVPAGATTNVVKQPTVTPKGAGTTITEPVRANQGFGSTPTTVKAPKIGDKAFAGAMGANAYLAAKASVSNGNLYKNYNKGNYVGTFLANEGLFSKIIVEETGLFSNTNKTVYVLSSNLTY